MQWELTPGPSRCLCRELNQGQESIRPVLMYSVVGGDPIRGGEPPYGGGNALV